MSIYAVYAELSDLAAYLGVAVGTLPATSTRSLTRASELVQQAMFENYDSNNADHVEAAKLATCAQVEYWGVVDESIVIGGGVQSFKVGDVTMDFGQTQVARGETNSLCQRSIAYLSQQFLLYRGLRRCRLTDSEV